MKNKFDPIDGIFLLNKSAGLSSNQALQRVRHLFKAKKAGHSGSLDPIATGMLPICFGEATKFSQYLLESDKQYLATCALGVRTNSGDSEGEVIAQKSVQGLTAEKLETVLTGFRGPQKQVPSMFSALKHKGQPLYKLARQGIEVERPAREIMIKALKLIEFSEDRFVIDVTCSKGTYIRTLVDDIGEALGCGAHVVGLHRTAVGPYTAENMMTENTLEALLQEDGLERRRSLLLPLDSSVAVFPAVDLCESSAFYIKKGQPVMVPKAPISGCVRLMAGKRGFFGIGEILEDGRVAPRRLISTKE